MIANPNSNPNDLTLTCTPPGMRCVLNTSLLASPIVRAEVDRHYLFFKHTTCVTDVRIPTPPSLGHLVVGANSLSPINTEGVSKSLP